MIQIWRRCPAAGLHRLKSALLASLLLVGLVIGAGGCSVNPATGSQSFTGFMSSEEETRVGREEHPKILALFGGEYDDPALKAYVTNVGEALLSASETPNSPFTFTVLNTPTVNAFALPGGYVYVTRGLLALAGTEAEMASVLGHEIGHVVARHSAQRYSRAVLGGIGAIMLGAVTGSQEVSELSSRLFQIHLQSYSREHEFEADLLGIRYMGRTGYGAENASAFLSKLAAHSKLEATIAGHPERADEFNIMATHPRTVDRVEAAAAAARSEQAVPPRPNGPRYLAHIDGMIYGDDPAQGVIKGRVFAHPDLKFRFEVPADYRLSNSPQKIRALHSDESEILFDGANVPAGLSMVAYLRDSWAKALRFDSIKKVEIDGMEAATGDTRIRDIDLRLLAVRFDRDTAYRFQFFTRRAHTRAHANDLQNVIDSFRRLSPREAAAITPLRLRVVPVGSRTTIDDLAGRMVFDDFREERFRVLNGLSEQANPNAGGLVKIVTD